MLSRIHGMELWLENGPINIEQKVIHIVTHYHIFDKKKTMQCQTKEVIKENTKVEWNGCELSISTIIDPLIEYVVRVISHKFYYLS